MPRHRGLQLQKFLDSVPESLLKEYFKQKIGKDQALPLKRFDAETISEFIETNKDEELIVSILNDFKHINDLCENVYNILIQAIDKYGILTSKESKREKLAFDIFLHHPTVYDYAYDRYCFFNSTSNMSQHNIEASDFDLTPEKLERFKGTISSYYADLAKGHECIIRHHIEDDQTVIVIMHGSYKRSMVVWEGNKTETIFFRPAHEDILAFDKNASILSIKARFAKDRKKYIEAFTNVLIEDKSQADREDRDATYTLEPIKNGSFSFEGNEYILSIVLTEVKVNFGGVSQPEITLKSKNIVETRTNSQFGIDLQMGHIIRVKFKFRLRVNRKERNISFTIQPPNITDLNKKKYADFIGAYLRENGIKLK